MNFLSTMRGMALKRAESLVQPEGRADAVRPFGQALRGRGISVIAEVKYATPTDGPLGLHQAPEELAAKFERLGAAAVSCLTEPEFFHGSLEHLGRIRRACSLPVLMKDFVVDTRQVDAGRALGADAVLLITEMLTEDELKTLHAHARALGMDCLVECHGPQGLEKALAVGATLVGVNCRDLATLKVDRRRHEELIGLLPGDVVKVAESGVTTGERLVELARLGYDAVLVGRAFVDETKTGEIFRVGKDLRDHEA
ncbi:MAG TPA: indole-3-glycerol-phosphate synthase [Deltaproteobacteria bacterium]|nr:indole-3-glycerol-phosphate synthase [Deltaproteobacteria bacterium]